MIKIDGAYLKDLRTSRKLSLQKLADVLDVSKNTIAYWEHNSTLGNQRIIRELCAFYDIPIEEFLAHGAVSADDSRELDLAIAKNLLASAQEEQAPAGKSEQPHAEPEAKDTRRRQRHSVLKTGWIALSVTAAIALLCAAGILLYIFRIAANTVPGSRIRLACDAPRLTALCLAFLLLPAFVAMSIRALAAHRGEKKAPPTAALALFLLFLLPTGLGVFPARADTATNARQAPAGRYLFLALQIDVRSVTPGSVRATVTNLFSLFPAQVPVRLYLASATPEQTAMTIECSEFTPDLDMGESLLVELSEDGTTRRWRAYAVYDSAASGPNFFESDSVLFSPAGIPVL